MIETITIDTEQWAVINRSEFIRAMDRFIRKESAEELLEIIIAAAPRPEAGQQDDVADHSAMREAKHRMITSQGWDRGQGIAFADGWTQCAYHYGIRSHGKIAATAPRPVPTSEQFNTAELGLIRQWYNCVSGTLRTYMDEDDKELHEKIARMIEGITSPSEVKP